MMELVAVNMWTIFFEVIKARRIALVCAAAVAVMAIGIFHAPALPVLLGCGGAVAILITRDCLFGRR
jgi:hypothetical protein